MCGRFANHVAAMGDWVEILGDWPAGIELGYNIAPTRIIPAVMQQGTRPMRWGLVPSWSKEESPRYATFNARLESVAQKPAFRDPWRKGQSCLVPALGYFEWRTQAGHKQPFFIRLSEGQPLVFAGLWEQRQGSLSCTILTRESEGALADLHPRMPVMLGPDSARTWLQEGAAALPELQNSRQHEAVRVHPVGRAVGNARVDGPELIEPVDLLADS